MQRILTVPPPLHDSCINCILRLICIPSCLKEEELINFSLTINKNFIIQKNSIIFEQHSPANYLYIIKSGAAKSTVTFSNQEQVTGFYLTGDILGLESIGYEKYINNLYTLQQTTLCFISIENLNILFKNNSKLSLFFLNLVANRLRKNQRKMILTQFEAKKRVSLFLLFMVEYYKEHMLSFEYIQLPMSKNDISNFLSLTPETLSRVFTQLKKDNIIKMTGKNIYINNFEYLHNLTK